MTAAPHEAYVDRWREQARARRIEDWRLVVYSTAIKLNVGSQALRVCDAICDHQHSGKFFYPHVWVGHDELAEELGMKEPNVRRALKQLCALGVFTVDVGGGRLPGTKGHKGKANTYRLGPACGRRAKGTARDPLSAVQTGSLEIPQERTPELQTGSLEIPHPFGVLRTPPGDTGERTVALTGDPTPSQLSSGAITQHRIRDLLRVFNPVKYGREPHP